MPELPEVENVRTSLEKLNVVGSDFVAVELLRKDLRVKFPRKISERLGGQRLNSIRRRAKYLLFETDDFILLSHLGMTGSWRVWDAKEKHDHVILQFSSGVKLVFNDPRRFGILDLVEKSKLAQCRWLKHLGVEPLSDEFNGDYLIRKTRDLKVSIKGFIMDQKHVVGVGNIYASEALFAARIKPARPAGKIKAAEAALLSENIQRILNAAIAAGGSTIRDYRNSEGKEGTFQNHFLVYDRAKDPCTACGAPIRSKVIAGRNTFWCAECQR